MTPERKFEFRSEAARFRVRDYPGIAEMLDEAVDEIERLQWERDAAVSANRSEFEGHKLTVNVLRRVERERDALLRVYEAVYPVLCWFEEHTDIKGERIKALAQSRFEAARVLEQGKEQ